MFLSDISKDTIKKTVLKNQVSSSIQSIPFDFIRCTININLDIKTGYKGNTVIFNSYFFPYQVFIGDSLLGQIVLVPGDRFLLLGQNDPIQNGIWDVISIVDSNNISRIDGDYINIQRPKEYGKYVPIKTGQIVYSIITSKLYKNTTPQYLNGNKITNYNGLSPQYWVFYKNLSANIITPPNNDFNGVSVGKINTASRVKLPEGQYPQASRLGIPSNINSIDEVADGYELQLYQYENFQGNKLTIKPKNSKEVYLNDFLIPNSDINYSTHISQINSLIGGSVLSLKIIRLQIIIRYYNTLLYYTTIDPNTPNTRPFDEIIVVNGAVSAWGSASVSQFSQTTPSNRPTLESMGVNFNRGNSQYLSNTNLTFNIQNGFTILAYIRFNSDLSSSKYERIFDFGTGSNTIYNNILLARYDTNSKITFQLFNEWNSILRIDSDIQENTMFLTAYRYSYSGGTGTLERYLNKTLDTTISNSTQVSARTLTSNFIGKSNWTYDSMLNATIGGILFYERKLSDFELNIASDALVNKVYNFPTSNLKVRLIP